MAHYPDHLRLIEARSQYFALLGKSDGGYDDNWVKLKMGPIPLVIPNTKARRKAVPIHDAHHVLTGYDPNWVGEFEISAWEIASGCGRYSFAWIINLQGFFAGLIYSPKSTMQAFFRGQHTSNLYHLSFSDQTLQKTLGDLRRQLGITSTVPEASLRDLLAFAFWAGIASTFSLACLALPLVILYWVINWLL